MEEEAVRAEIIGVLDDPDGGVFPARRRLGDPVRRNEAGIADDGQFVELTDDVRGAAAHLSSFFSQGEFPEAVGPGGQADHGGGGDFQRRRGERPEKSSEAPALAPDPVPPEEKEAEEGKQIIAAAQQAEAFLDEDRVSQEGQDPERVENRDRLVRPLEGSRGENRPQDDEHTDEEAEPAHRHAAELGDRGKGRAVAVEKRADVAEGAGPDRFGKIGRVEMTDRHGRGGDHAGPGDEAPESLPPASGESQRTGHGLPPVVLRRTGRILTKSRTDVP
ncbi:MAG: hypothetical protein BWX98_00001 [Candidatus Aminicenantes bacterium ADurb.Bin147]|nr:MAG: hypothetical protein BWX98_00001 [Candidatus Aminicenantes bacterium ADurb.Bin147]